MSKKLSDKDLRDWENFVNSKDKISSKEELNKNLVDLSGSNDSNKIRNQELPEKEETS